MEGRKFSFAGTDRFAKGMIILLSLVIAALVTWFWMWRSGLAAQAKMQEHLASEVLRFHILANSDSDSDQKLKLTIRDQILDYLEVRMPEGLDVTGTKRWMRRHVDDLEELGRKAAAEEGFDYPVTAAVTTCWFPDRTYGDLTFPAGNYEALRVEIGDAKGHNWWCVLYPGLCFFDSVNVVVPEKSRETLQNVLTEEEYAFMENDFQIKWYFAEQWKK